jgi:uncharacterized protein involved in exopolysaccharide biosynthesis/Mrp family chromosome partitioning ATPase
MVCKTQTGLTPREVMRVLFRHRGKIALFFCGALALTLLGIAVYPRSYTSEAKLFIRVGRESVALDPTATTGQTIMLQKTQADEVNSALQIVESREVMRRVVERLGAARILNDSPPKGDEQTAEGRSATWVDHIAATRVAVGSWLSQVLRQLRLSDPASPEDLAIRRLENGVKTWAPKDSTVITVSYSAASPQLAHDVVETITDVFLDEHVRLNHTEGSLRFFSEQAEKVQKELNAAQDALRDRKDKFHFASLESRRAIFAEQVKDVELQLLNTPRELAFSNAQIADLTQATAGLKPELVTNRVAGFANEGKDLMREKLYELEIEESKLKSRFKAEHPLLVQVEKQRKAAEAVLAGLPDDRTQTKQELNPNQRALELELIDVKAKNQALQARQAAAEKQRDHLNKELQDLNEQEVELSQLERNVQILDGKYRMHVAKLEEARVNDALGREQISNVKVAQPATLVGKPSSPKKPLLLALGLTIAFCGSIGWAFMAETFDQTLRTTEQVESALGVPVLASFPYRKRGRGRAKSQDVAASAETNDHSSSTSIGEVPNRYRALVGELLCSNGNGNGKLHGKAVGVVGCEASDSRSRVAAGLAVQAASLGTSPVLLIDADERHRRVARHFKINGSPGWRELLAGMADTESCVHRQTNGTLAVMPPGGQNGHASNGKPPGSTSAQLEKIKADYGIVVIDLPAPGTLEPVVSPGWLDETVMVVEAERTRVQSAIRAKEVLERAGIRLRGVVLANRREHVPHWLYQRL